MLRVKVPFVFWTMLKEFGENVRFGTVTSKLNGSEMRNPPGLLGSGDWIVMLVAPAVCVGTCAVNVVALT